MSSPFKPSNMNPSPEEAWQNVDSWLAYLLALPENEQSGAKNAFIGALAANVPTERWNSCLEQIQRNVLTSLTEVSK